MKPLLRIISLLVLALIVTAATIAQAQIGPSDDECSPDALNERIAERLERYTTDVALADDADDILDLMAGLVDDLNLLLIECGPDEPETIPTSPPSQGTPLMLPAVEMGEADTVLGGQGTMVIRRVIRPASGDDASVLRGATPAAGREFVLLWASFTCEQDECDPLENIGFFLFRDQDTVYINQTLTTGELFEDQLAGELIEGESVSGWIIFDIEAADTGLILVVGEDASGFFEVADETTSVETATIVASGSVNLRECGSTDCRVITTANSGDTLFVIGQDGDWYEVRTDDGVEAFIFGNLIRLDD